MFFYIPFQFVIAIASLQKTRLAMTAGEAIQKN